MQSQIFRMHFGRQVAPYLLVLLLLVSVACNKKKPHLPVQAHAPTLSVPVPDQIPEPETPQPEPSTTASETPAPEPPKPKTKHRKTTSKKPVQSPAATPPPSGTTAATVPGNTAVAVMHPPPNPAADAAPPDPAIGADVSNEQLTQQKQTTLQMLDATEKNLKGLSRNLNHDEEAMVTQIKSYLAQSRKATTDGDFERAYNLATKARLLSDALLKK